MLHRILKFFRTRDDAPRLSDEGEVQRLYAAKRRSVYLSLVLGYGFFYTTRLSLSVAKKPMLDAGVVSVSELGVIGASLLYVYAIGKFVNGVLADRSNVARFMSCALLGSAVINLVFGSLSGATAFTILWGLNGWFQSIGSAPSVVSLCQWFSHKERGTRYGIWAGAHNIGEGITFLVTPFLISLGGWRMGFWGPGIACVVVASVLSFTLADRPQTYGLPDIATFNNDHPPQAGTKESVRELQWMVIKNPIVWALGISSAMMYVTRYAIHSWGPLYLSEAKGYSVTEAGALIGANTLLGLAGAAFSGFLSDRFFGSSRNVPTLLYGLLLTGSLCALYSIPPGNTKLDALALAAFEFAIGGLIVFLAGLTAVDLVPTKAAGTAKGLIGLFSYLGAATQDWVSGLVIESGKVEKAGEVVYQFDAVFAFWIGASVVSLLVALTVWNAKPQE